MQTQTKSKTCRLFPDKTNLLTGRFPKNLLLFEIHLKYNRNGESDKFLVIAGPCSADNEASVCECVNRLAKVKEKVKDYSVFT